MTKNTGKRNTKRIFYSGDRNIENGGYFYNLSTWQWDYVEAVRVTPCPDMDGPDNLFYVEKLTLNIRKGDALKSVLACSGSIIFNEEGEPFKQSRNLRGVLSHANGRGVFRIHVDQLNEKGRPARHGSKGKPCS